MTGQNPELLKQWVLNPLAPSVEIRWPRQDEEEPAVGKGFEVELGKFWLNGETHKWVGWATKNLLALCPAFAAVGGGLFPLSFQLNSRKTPRRQV